MHWHETRQGSADQLEQELAAEAAETKAAKNDPFGARHTRGARTQEAVKSLGEHLQDLRDKGDITVSSEELEAWREEGGFSNDTWTKAREHLDVKTAPCQKGSIWTQDLDDLEWLRNLPSKQAMCASGRGFNDPTVDLKAPQPHRPGMPPGVKTP